MESQIKVSMFDDRIEIISPGGLPSGITEDEYLAGKLSVLRNRNLANVGYSLGVIGSDKTFTMVNVIAQLNKLTLIITYNKMLAAQLYGEFKKFFPDNAMEYFIS